MIVYFDHYFAALSWWGEFAVFRWPSTNVCWLNMPKTSGILTLVLPHMTSKLHNSNSILEAIHASTHAQYFLSHLVKRVLNVILKRLRWKHQSCSLTFKNHWLPMKIVWQEMGLSWNNEQKLTSGGCSCCYWVPFEVLNKYACF